MTNKVVSHVECDVLAHFSDHGKPETARPAARVETSYPPISARFADRNQAASPLLPFVILLKDNKTVCVRGHGVEAGPENTRQIIRIVKGQKVCVAMFESAQIIGIYEGTAVPA